MDRKKVKKDISDKKMSFGSWIQIPDVFTAEMMARSGFDWLAIDLEHGMIDLETAFRADSSHRLFWCDPSCPPERKRRKHRSGE